MNKKSTDCSKEVMCDVADCERKRLYLLCAATLPTLVVLLCVTAYSTHNTISRVRQKAFIPIAEEIAVGSNKDIMAFRQFVVNIFEETYKGTLGLGLGSLTLALIVSHKTKLTQIPSRLRQTQKYLSN